ncbi:hydroxyacid dehydrogenase [candidate division KSB1 bacterium]|nr:hydroxyacid dehydrogenase [candidate division KSB1 bacterium]
MKPKVLLSEDINPAGKNLLKKQFEILIAPNTSEETLLKMIPDVFGIILRATSKVNGSVIEKAEKLKVVARTGVGVDNVDIDVASKRGIYVCYTPGMNNITVAEQTLAMILGLAKQIIHMDRSVRTQCWYERFSEKQAEIEGKTLGIVGLGAIGLTVARKCGPGLGMQILAYDPLVSQQIEESYIRFAESLEKLFQEADFITIHTPNIPENRGLINRGLLSQMKKSAYFINTARGELVDEQALIELLQQHKIAGAALDVFLTEPLPANSPFMKMDNVLLAPHVAGSTWESNVRIAESAARAVLDVWEGRMPEFVYNKDLLVST